MENNLDRKELRRITRLYGAIVIVINIIGFLFATSNRLPVRDSDDYRGWALFLNDYSMLNGIVAVLSFAFPAVCISR